MKLKETGVLPVGQRSTIMSKVVRFVPTVAIHLATRRVPATKEEENDMWKNLLKERLYRWITIGVIALITNTLYSAYAVHRLVDVLHRSKFKDNVTAWIVGGQFLNVATILLLILPLVLQLVRLGEVWEQRSEGDKHRFRSR